MFMPASALPFVNIHLFIHVAQTFLVEYTWSKRIHKEQFEVKLGSCDKSKDSTS